MCKQFYHHNTYMSGSALGSITCIRDPLADANRFGTKSALPYRAVRAIHKRSCNKSINPNPNNSSPYFSKL